MKLAVAFGLLAVALASQHWDQRPQPIGERSFRAGKHYTFHFDGQISTGLPTPSSQHSINRIESIVSLVIENDRTALLKLQKTRMGSVNRDVSEPREVQPFGVFEESEMTPEQRETLALPVRFRYEHGLISELHFDNEEQTWSANMKRAVLNMLNVNLAKRNEKEQRLRDDAELTEDVKPTDYFTTHEKTLEGDCETLYTIVPTSEESIKLEKSVNFDKCLKRVDVRYNMRFTEECPSCEIKSESTESSSVYKYDLVYESTPRDFLIRSVELNSIYTTAPLNKEHSIVSTFVANKLCLIKVDEDKSAVPTPKTTKRVESLVYSTEWEERLERFRMTGEESLLIDTPYTWMEKKMDIVPRIIKNLKSELKMEKVDETEEYTPEVNHLIARLVEVLRVSSIKEIHEIAKECKEPKLRALFFDALAIAGTKPCIEYFTKKTMEKEITPLKATHMLKMLINMRNPSEPIVDELIKLCKDDVSEKNPLLKQSCWLTTGSVLSGLCGEKRDRLFIELNENKESTRHLVCRREMKEKYVEVFERLFAKASTRYEKVLAIKAMSNAGFDLIVFPLEKIIRDERVEKTIRIKAINGLRRLRSTMPRKVHTILMPLFKNHREVPEIRMAAFHMIMSTLPERVVIDQLVAQLNKEPSVHVASFVYKHLEQLTKTTVPCEKDLARDIEQALRVLRITPKMTASTYFRPSFYSENLLTGASLNLGSVYSKDSVLPKEISASLDTIFGGEWTKYAAQIGLYQQNLDQWLWRLVEKLEKSEGEMTMKMDDVIVRGKRSMMPKPSEALRTLMEKLNIKERRSIVKGEKEAHAFLYIRHKDMDFAVLPVEEKTIEHLSKQILKGGKLNIAEVEKVLAKGYDFELHAATFAYEHSRLIPTTAGLPIKLTSKLPTILSLKGSIKAELSPKSGSPSALKLRVEAEPKISSTHVISMEVRSPILSNGVKMLHSAVLSLPMDSSLELDWTEKLDAKLTMRTPEKERKMLSLISRPVTYIRYESVEKKCEMPFEKTVFTPRSEEYLRLPVDSVYGEELFGLRFNVIGNVHRHLIEPQPTRSPIVKFVPALTGENHLEVVVGPSEETPREYVIRMRFDGEPTTRGHPEEFEKFYEKETREHFEVEDSEYENEEESERIEEFGSYIKSYKDSRRPAYKGRMHVTVKAVGGRKERNVEVEFGFESDKEMNYVSYTLDARRSPMFSEERREWTLAAKLHTLLPKSVASLYELSEQKHRELSSILFAKWGSEEKNMLKARVQLSQSAEQQKWQKLTLKKDNKMEKNYERLVLASRLNQLKAVLDYEMTPEMLVRLSPINALIKSFAPLTVEIEPLEKFNKPEGRVLLTATVEPQTWRYMNFSMESPVERVVLRNIRLPFRPTFIGIEKRERKPESISELTRSLIETPVCEITSSKISTFDEVIFRAPLTTCYSVLAKDCSEKPRFAIMMKKVEKKSEEKKMKIVTEEYTFELEMNMDNEFIVKVDGKKINEAKWEKYGMEKLADEVIFETEDFKIRFNGYKAWIELAEYYKGQQCGLCGHFDGERDNEFRRADNVETRDLEEFHRSFLVREDDECMMEESKLSEKKAYKLYTEEERSSSSSEEEKDEFEYVEDIFETEKPKKMNKRVFDYEEDKKEEVEPKEITKVVEYSGRVCFSHTPVPECPKKTYESEEDKKDIKVKFSCLERSEPEARRLMREARREVLRIELPVSFVETMTVPKTCVVY